MPQKQSIAKPSWRRIRGTVGLGTALANMRKEKSMTQAQLARALGINRMTMARMESGENQTLQRLIKAFSLLGFDLVVVPRTAHVEVRNKTEPMKDGSDPVAEASP